MISSQLIASLITNVWAIEPNAAQGYFPIVNRLLSGDMPIDSNDKIEIKSASYPQKGGSNSDEKSVLVLSYKDVILKGDQPCGGHIGTDTLAAHITQASKDDSIAAIVIQWDTPGGSTNACVLPSHAIQEAKKLKPVLSFVDNGMCASAGYYIASNSNEIYASFKSDQIGSIGTYMTIADWAKFHESKGLPIYEIYATKSTNKNGAFRQLMSATTKEEKDAAISRLQTEYLDPFNQEFLDTVITNRETIQEGSLALTGEMFKSNDALEIGLIDGIKTFDQVIQRAFDLSQNYNVNNSTNINSKTMFGKQFKSLTSFAKSEIEDRTPEMLDAINQDLQASGIDGFLMEATEGISSVADVTKSLSDAKDLVSAANASKEAAETNAADLQGQLDTAKARITELEAASAGDSRSSAESNDELDSQSTEKILAGLPHNQKADNLF